MPLSEVLKFRKTRDVVTLLAGNQRGRGETQKETMLSFIAKYVSPAVQ